MMAEDSKKAVSKGAQNRTLSGNVVSDKMHKTVVVKVNRTFKHALLGKTVTTSKKYKVHDEKEVAKVGDKVEIVECRPLSKTKHMKLHAVLRSAD